MTTCLVVCDVPAFPYLSIAATLLCRWAIALIVRGRTQLSSSRPTKPGGLGNIFLLPVLLPPGKLQGRTGSGQDGRSPGCWSR